MQRNLADTEHLDVIHGNRQLARISADGSHVYFVANRRPCSSYPSIAAYTSSSSLARSATS